MIRLTSLGIAWTSPLSGCKGIQGIYTGDTGRIRGIRGNTGDMGEYSEVQGNRGITLDIIGMTRAKF